MAVIPEYEARDNADTGSRPVRVDAPNLGGTILAGSLEKVSNDAEDIFTVGKNLSEAVQRKAMHQDEVIARLSEEKMNQIESLQISSKVSQMRSDFYGKLQKMQDNPSENMLQDGTKDFEDYTKEMVGSGITPRVQSELAIHAQDFGITYKNELWRAQRVFQQQQFGATFDKMLTNANDSIYSAKSLDELHAQQDLLGRTVDDAVKSGRIRDPETIQSLHEKIPILGVSWAEANLTDNPKLVKDVAQGNGPYANVMNGVSPEQRTVLLNKATEVIKTQDDQQHVSLRTALESDKVQRIQTGEGKSLDMKAFSAAFGAEAADKAQRELDQATELHTYVEQAKGASTDSLRDMLTRAMPKADPTNPLYGEQLDQYQNVQKVVSQAVSDRKDDPFTYFSLNPSVKPYADKFLKDATPENQISLQHAVLAQMKSDKTFPESQYALMPKAQAEQFINQFNTLTAIGSDKKSVVGVTDLLNNFEKTYGDNIHIALNQLNNTQGGAKISPVINPLMWHLQNPSVFNLIVQAVRKDPKEAMERFGDEKTAKDFVASAKFDSNLLNYQSSIYSTSNTQQSQSLVKGVRETYSSFARDYVQNGGKLKDASSVFFGPYTWGNENGVSFARPRQYTDSTGSTHSLSDQQVDTSNSFLHFYSSRLNPNDIAPESILNQTRYFTSEQLTKDTKDALDHTTFWSTTEDEKGVYLYAKGELAGAPRQVFKKDGSPVRVNFEDTLVPANAQMMTYDTKSGKMKEPYTGGYTPRTDDTWVDRMANLMGGIND